MASLRERLEQLGVRQGLAGLRAPVRHRCGIEEVVSGRLVQTEHGPFFLAEEVYPADYTHGQMALSSLLDHPPDSVIRLARCPLDFYRAAFIDVETTSLVGGTGTYVFMVGVGFYDEDRFRLRQFFMRDYGEERALLHHLADTLTGFDTVVSFNGKTFDVPLLETRFTLWQMSWPLTDALHLDLLHPSRRLWRMRLGSCALSSLETHTLGVQRDQADVPGWLIPERYFDYLQTGDARYVQSVFYHNAQDILSLVTLASHLCAMIGEPWGRAIDGVDLFSLGRLYEEMGLVEESERAYRGALSGELPPEVRAAALRNLSFLLKRAGRREEAAEIWRTVVDEGQELYPYVELAKHGEWQTGDIESAAELTRRAIALVEGWPAGHKRRKTLAELRHRLARLERKLQCVSTAPQSDP